MQNVVSTLKAVISPGKNHTNISNVKEREKYSFNISISNSERGTMDVHDDLKYDNDLIVPNTLSLKDENGTSSQIHSLENNSLGSASNSKITKSSIDRSYMHI
jgi:hypothetical protein